MIRFQNIRSWKKPFVPKLNEEQINDEGELILRLYYPEALVEPIWISARLLAERMGLRVR
jgi:hypothetical protein